MKHFLPSLIFLMLPVCVSAQDLEVEIEGLYYALDEEKLTAEVITNDQAEGDVVIPSTVSYNGTDFTVTRIGDCAFSYCSDLFTVVMPNTVTSIGLEGFSYCTSLESIEMSDNITEISEAAFWGCSSLTKIELPDNIEYLTESVFEDCKKLTSITLPANLNTISSRALWGCSSLTEIELPKNLKTISEYSFWGCSALKSITLPASLESIGCVSFVGCDNLGVIKCESSEPVHVALNDYIEQKFFMTWTGQTKLYVPEGSESKYANAEVWNAFKECHGYKEGDVIETDIVKNVTVDGINYAITKYNHVAKVARNNKFEGDAVISDVINVDGEDYVVKFITDQAFENCETITSVEIPETIESIGQLAFSVCTELMDIYSKISEPFAIDNYVFDTLSNYGMMLYVPSGSKAKYEATKYWNQFPHIVEKEYTSIESISNIEEGYDKIFDLQGRSVKHTNNGIYIKNGKKQIMK